MAGSSLALPNGDFAPGAPTWSQDSHTVKSEQVSVAEPTATTGNITASGAGNSIVVEVRGYSTVLARVSGTFTGLIGVWEGSDDDGSTYNAILASTPASGLTAAAITAAGQAILNCNGLTHVRLNPAAFSTGTAAVRFVPSAMPWPQWFSAAQLADPLTPGIAMQVGALNYLYNGSTSDFQRGNIQGTAIASGARTATNNSSDITNHNARGVVLMLNVTAVTATPLLQVNVQGKDPVSSSYYKIAVDPTAVGATGLFVYEFYPGASTAAAGGVTARTACSVPRTFRVIATHGDTDSITYSVGYSLIV